MKNLPKKKKKEKSHQTKPEKQGSSRTWIQEQNGIAQGGSALNWNIHVLDHRERMKYNTVLFPVSFNVSILFGFA